MLQPNVIKPMLHLTTSSLSGALTNICSAASYSLGLEKHTYYLVSTENRSNNSSKFDQVPNQDQFLLNIVLMVILRYLESGAIK